MTNHAEDEISQSERKRVLENDRKVMATYHSFASSDLADDRGGRFSSLDKPVVTGSSSIAYPQLPEGNPWAKNELPDEPLIDGRGEGNVTGYEIDRPDAPPSSASSSVGDGGVGDRATTATGSP